MEIQKYSSEQESVEQLVKLIDSLYLSSQHLDLYKRSIRESLTDKNPFFKFAQIVNYIAFDQNEPVGHISGIIDERLPGVGLVGFFESKNAVVAKELIDQTVSWFKEQGVKTVRGPINLSIWHRYRFVNEGDSTTPFLLEPFNHSEYPNYFTNNNFKVAEDYISGLRHDFKDIMDYTKTGFESMAEKGVSIRAIDLSKFEEELKIFHQLSLEIFKDSWSFVPISFDEFKSLYGGLEKVIDAKYCEFMCKDGKEIGFCFSVPDFTNPDKCLILKTIGLLPEYQKQNLGSALIYNQHLKATNDGYKTIIYALIREGNRASKINPYGATLFRKYQTYELNIS